MNKKYFGYGLSLVVITCSILGVLLPQIFFRITVQETNAVEVKHIVEIFNNSSWITTLKEHGFYSNSIYTAITLVAMSLIHFIIIICPLKGKLKGHIIRAISFVIVACSLILMAQAYHVGSSDYLLELKKNVLLGTKAKFGIGAGIYFIIVSMITSVGIAIKPSFYSDDI